VLTSVDRDDLPDGGSGHFAQTVRALKVYPLLANGELVILCIYHAEYILFFLFFSGVEAWDIGGVLDFRFSR